MRGVPWALQRLKEGLKPKAVWDYGEEVERSQEKESKDFWDVVSFVNEVFLDVENPFSLLLSIRNHICDLPQL